MADERNEQSVLISLDSLAANEEDKKAGAASGGESGLIDIGALESAGLLDDVDDAGPMMAVAPSSAGAVRTRRRGGGTIVGLVIGAALLIAGSVYVTMELTKPKPTETARSESTKTGDEATAKAGDTTTDPLAPRTPDPATAAKTADAGATTAGKADEKKPDAGVTVAAAKSDKSGKADKSDKSDKSGTSKRRTPTKKAEGTAAAPASPPPSEPARPAVAAAPPPKAPEKSEPDEVDDMLDAVRTGKAVGGSGPAGDSPSDDALLPTSLSRGQILKVVRTSAAQVRKCKGEAGGESGTVMVKVTIEGTGSVKDAEVVSGQKGSPLGGCVERKVKVFRFPQFSGAEMSVRLPFSI